MNDATKAMYAKILADAQAKANAKSQPTAPKPAALPASKPTPAPAVNNTVPFSAAIQKVINTTPATPAPEMSNITFADLMNNDTTPAPAEVKPQPAAIPGYNCKVIGEFTFIEYSPACFALQGPTFPVKDEMRKFNGKWNRFLKVGPAWIFEIKKYYIVKSFIERLQATS